jgi:hypothetical protein
MNGDVGFVVLDGELKGMKGGGVWVWFGIEMNTMVARIM